MLTEQRECTASDPLTPAAQAGLREGDRIVSFNGTPITRYAELTDLIRRNLDGPATFVVERGGQQVTLPTVNTIISGVRDDLDPSKLVPAGWMGLYPSSRASTPGRWGCCATWAR